jgi:hypothetical protein
VTQADYLNVTGCGAAWAGQASPGSHSNNVRKGRLPRFTASDYLPYLNGELP